MKRNINRLPESLMPYHGTSSSNRGKRQSTSIAKRLRARPIQVLLVLAFGAILSVISFLHPPTVTRVSQVRSNAYSRGLPAGLVVRPTVRTQYVHVPENCKHTFHVPDYVRHRLSVVRTLRSLGWTMATNASTAHVIWDNLGLERYSGLHPWQRINQIPGHQSWDHKDRFKKGFQEYQERNPGKQLLFLPETYVLDSEGQRAFEQRLDKGGMEQPWVLKIASVNRGIGTIEMLGANSIRLQNVIDSTQGSYIIQAFICNGLTWFGKRKFDFRMYWMVPSIDPLIVLYTDGFARVDNTVYDETDFSNTKKHLTSESIFAEKGTMDEAKTLIHQHYQHNVAELSKRFKGDPYQHVRNQMKEAIAETVAAFRDKTFGNDNTTTFAAENSFAFYGADFVLDNNLDVWYLESQFGPAMIEDYHFKVTTYRQLLRTTFTVMQEIQDKIEANPNSNILPLESDIEGWDIVYAGDWMYQYDDYQRQPSKQSCRVAQNQNGSQVISTTLHKDRTSETKF